VKATTIRVSHHLVGRKEVAKPPKASLFGKVARASPPPDGTILRSTTTSRNTTINHRRPLAPKMHELPYDITPKLPMGNTYSRETLILLLILFIASWHPLPCHFRLGHRRIGWEDLGATQELP
jgi:hypothetical protein